MFRKFRLLIQLMRPLQGYKAGIVWLPALFHGFDAIRENLLMLLVVSIAWLLISSVIYIVNDVIDAPSDRRRADRMHRPIASGDVKIREAILLLVGILALLAALSFHLPGRLYTLFAIYAALNTAYSLGLKQHLGLRQAIIAIGFWLRLQSGADPITPIPLTSWASLFTLGLAYQLNCFKGLESYNQDHHRGYRFAMGLGAALAGGLSLAALVAICLKRGLEGSMHFPELPPLLCLVGMHRVSMRSFRKDSGKEQAKSFFMDPATLVVMILFVVFFLIG